MFFKKPITVLLSGILTASLFAGTVTVSASEPIDGRYVNVGKGRIAEIVGYEAETFNAYSTNDWSRPTNNYLPKGTVDYCSEKHYYHKGETEKEYVLLRCGRQVYTYKKNLPSTKQVQVVKEYYGTLPSYNKLNIADFKISDNHTVLVLDTLWKAPFYFDIRPQKYEDKKNQNYMVSDFTAKYIDITFCYAKALTGELTIPKDNPLFKAAKIIKNKSDYTLRLYFKKTGGFYGWDSRYNSKGQLVFSFLNPAKVKASKNSYGANLKGVTVLIDVGHGGKDPGAVSYSNYYTEARQNLKLAKKIARELKKIGATVKLTRTDNTTSTTDSKIKLLKKLKPDLCIAVHHDSSKSQNANGFHAYYSTPFSYKAAKYIYKNTKNTNIYKSNKIGWHYYFMARSSCCPVVLTENGFMSNYSDYNSILSDSKNTKKAKAIVKGVAQYFLSISPK